MKPVEKTEPAAVPRAASESGTRDAAAVRFAAALCLLFLVQGWIFIPYPGIQNDEALFAAGIYPPSGVEHSVTVFDRVVPTMLISYLGALKLWIYKALFQVWPPSAYSFRVPPLVLGAVTIWLLFLLTRRTVGSRAALAACALIATDASYLLTTTYDWGPVALQHFLLLGGILLLYRFHLSGRTIHLAAGFFGFGLALWDKAVFVWILVGVTVATAVLFPRELWRRMTGRNIAAAALFFTLGALPLVIYNLDRDYRTFLGNTRYSTDKVAHKVLVLRAGLEGTSLMGYITRDRPAAHPGWPRTAIERASIGLSEIGGRRVVSFMVVAMALATLALPFLWRSPEGRPMLFALLVMGIAWLQMAFNKDTGDGTHHTVLFWPFPQFYVGAAFAGATRRFGRAGLIALILAVTLVCGSALLVTNEHLAQFVRNGSGLIWTDAIYPLSEFLAATPARNVFVMDWGMMDALRALNRGRLPLQVGSDPFLKPEMDDADRRFVDWMLAQPDALFIGHAKGSEIFEGVSAKSEAAAAAAGYRKEQLKEIGDRHGRPVFEVYRYRKEPAPRS